MNGFLKNVWKRYKNNLLSLFGLIFNMVSIKTIAPAALPFLCILQSFGVIGFCLYKLYSDSEKSELWIAIICSVLGCVSGKAHLSTKKKNKDVVLPGNTVG